MPMSVAMLKQTSVTPMPCVTTPRDPTPVAVREDMREMVQTAQVSPTVFTSIDLSSNVHYPQIMSSIIDSQ